MSTTGQISSETFLVTKTWTISEEIERQRDQQKNI